ncbi:little elongation complex subunit 1 isoform X1 [Arapaima gigas]
MEKTPEKGSKKDAEDTPFEDALDIVPNGHNHIQNPSANVANLDHHPALLPEGMLYENGNNVYKCWTSFQASSSTCRDWSYPATVIKSHVSIGRISKLPVLRDEEKEVIAEFCMEKKALVDDFLSAVSMKLKTEKNSLSGEQLQALCRVYTGLCRQRGDWERPHLLAYCILKEDFPDSAKLILFVVTTWYNIFMQRGVVCNAMHAVIRQKAHGEVLKYLTAYLDWETVCTHLHF